MRQKGFKIKNLDQVCELQRGESPGPGEETGLSWSRGGRDRSEGGERVIAYANKQHRRIADAKGF